MSELTRSTMLIRYFSAVSAYLIYSTFVWLIGPLLDHFSLQQYLCVLLGPASFLFSELDDVLIPELVLYIVTTLIFLPFYLKLIKIIIVSNSQNIRTEFLVVWFATGIFNLGYRVITGGIV